MPEHWNAGWYAAPSDAWPGPRLPAGTLRQNLRVHGSGNQLRIRLQNRTGRKPVRISAAWVARESPAGPPAQLPGGRAVTFGGQPGVLLPAGGTVASDPVDFPVRTFDRLTISLDLPDGASRPAGHLVAREVPYVCRSGDACRQEDGAGFRALPLELRSSWYFLEAVEVAGPVRRPTLVVAGDSISEGSYSLFEALQPAGALPDTGADRRFSDFLAARLDSAGVPLTVLNAALSGNRLLSKGALPGFGDSLLNRLATDVLAHPHVTHVLALIGTNDLGTAPWERRPGEFEVIDGLRRLVHACRAAGVQVLLGTLPPAGGTLFGRRAPLGLTALHGRPDALRMRRYLNQWIRTNPCHLPVLDFDAALRDPAAPDCLRPEYDSGDGLHPNAAGAAAMADCVDLADFTQ